MVGTVAIPVIVAGYFLFATVIAGLTAIYRLFTLGDNGESSVSIILNTLLLTGTIIFDIYVIVLLTRAIF